MKIVLFVEGYTEKMALPTFLKRWLDAKLAAPIGIKTVRFEGWSEYARDIPGKVRFHLSGKTDVVGAVGLLDLYGPTIYPPEKKTAADRYTWGKAHFEKAVGNPRFRQHFATHETEAWLLSDPSIFPRKSSRPCPAKPPGPRR